MANTNESLSRPELVTQAVNQLNDQEVKMLQSQFRQPTRRQLIVDMSNRDELFTPDNSTDKQLPTEADVLNQKIKSSLSHESNWRKNHQQRANQTDIATGVFEKLDENKIDTLKEYYGVDEDYDLIDTMGDYDELFEAVDDKGNELEGAAALEHNVNNIYAQALYDRNHTQRNAQTDIAREIVTDELDAEHVESMKHYYEAEDNEDLIAIMGDDDSLFEATDKNGQALEGKAAVHENVNQIHDEHLTMGLDDGLDDLSDLQTNEQTGPTQN